MTAIRQDAWTEEDDAILAEVTLRHIREGSTQLKAFEEVGERIGRTSAACGFRWNSCVRKMHERKIKDSKAQRKQRKFGQHDRPATLSGNHTQLSDYLHLAVTDMPIASDDPIWEQFEKWWQEGAQWSAKLSRWRQESQPTTQTIESLQQENHQLRQQLKTLQHKYQVIEQDYKSLIGILERARNHQSDPAAARESRADESYSSFKAGTN